MHEIRLVLLLPLLLSISVAGEDDVHIEQEGDDVVVRSPISKHNFLFRAPTGFKEARPPDGFLVALEAKEGDGMARVRLRVSALGAQTPPAFLAGRQTVYQEGFPKETATKSERGRWRYERTGETGRRTILVVFDGASVYELILDALPADGPLAKSLETIAAGFTVLDPKGPPEGAAAVPTPEELAPKSLEKTYYRLKVFKPAGFAQEPVDPTAEPGIVYSFRRQDAERNLCLIRIRVHLRKTLKQALDVRAQTVIDKFAAKYKSPKVPRRPQRARVAGAKSAYKLKLLGRAPKTSAIVQEDWRLVDHENGRVYEIQMTQYGAAARVFRKEISAFWKKLKFTNPQ